MLSHVQLFLTVACQAPLSVGFSRQEYWSGLPFPSPGDLPDPGMELVSFMSLALAGRFFTISTNWEAQEGERLNDSMREQPTKSRMWGVLQKD